MWTVGFARRRATYGSIACIFQTWQFRVQAYLLTFPLLPPQIAKLCKLTLLNRVREENGDPPLPCVFHQLFLGNPGTGKTTVARLYASLLCELGVLDSEEVIETTPQEIKGQVGLH